jgi:hypothetical protein
MSSEGGTMEQSMATTVDNPYDPFTSFDEWLAFDEAHGYFTMNLIARVLVTSEELSEADQEMAIEDAVNEVVQNNVIGLYRKVRGNSSTSSSG